MYRKSYEVIGYTYDADTHCKECAAKKFKNPDNATDSEGNEVHPIFLSDEFDETPYCGDCLTELDY